MANNRSKYIQEMEAELNKLASQIERLLEKAEATARVEYKKQAEALGPKLSAGRKKLEELRAASVDAWEDLKPGFEKAWTELSASFKTAASRYKKD